MATETSNTANMERGHFNSVQLNLVTFVDVYRALATKSLEGNVYMMDNCVDSAGQGTPNLQTTCKQGQVLNWIIYPLDMNKRINGVWPPMVEINNIVILQDDGDVVDHKVFDNLKVYGPPDKIRSPLTPVYYYWAGMVLQELTVGEYPYRMILKLDSMGTDPLYLNLDTPALNVIAV
jgi:hypothetical protein